MKRVSCRFKERIAGMASQEEAFKSGAHMLQVIKRLNIKHGISSLRVATNWVSPVMAKFLAAIKLFVARIEIGAVSISWDATRLSRQRSYVFNNVYERKGVLVPANGTLLYCNFVCIF